jgi:hypothetical protein
VASANDVTLVDANAIDLTGANIAGNLSLAANGAITDSGTIVVSGSATLAAGAGNDITLNNADDFTTVNVASGNHVTLTDVNALDIGVSNISGDLSLTAGSALTQSGALSVAGNSTFSAGAGGITLLNVGNALRGAVSLASGGNAAIDNAGALSLGVSTIAGSLTVTANGSVTDSGPLTVGSTTGLTTHGNGSDITLDEASRFSGAVSLSVPGSTAIRVINVDADLTLGTVTGGEVILAAGGSILDGNGAANNINAATAVTLMAGTGTIGVAAQALGVDAPIVAVSAAGVVQEISVNIEGTVTDHTLHVSNTPLGLVVLNGSVIGGAATPAPPGVNPSSRSSAAVTAVGAFTNANGDTDIRLPNSTAESIRSVAYSTDSVKHQFVHGCNRSRRSQPGVPQVEFGVRLPEGVQPMLERQERIIEKEVFDQDSNCSYRN